MRKLIRDPYLLLALVLIAVPLGLYVWPGVEGPAVVLWAGHLADPLFLLLAIVTLIGSRRESLHAEERLFWRLVLATCALWLAGSSVALLAELTSKSHRSSVVSDLFYLGSYVTLILAADLRPHLPAGWSRRSSGFWFSVWASMLCLMAIAAYFFALPFIHLSGASGTFSTQSTFVALDLLLALRFAHLLFGARNTPWAAVYGWLALSSSFAAATDGINIAMLTGAMQVAYGTALDALWWMPFVCVILARRWRTSQIDGDEHVTRASDEEPRTDAIELLLLYALAFPAAHLALDATGLLPTTRGTRQLVVLGALLAFVTLAVFQQRLLERRHRELSSQVKVLVTNEQVLQSQKMEAIGRLAGGLAHDFNNLLTVVEARADMLLCSLPSGGTAWHNAQAIQQSAERGAALTRQLLTFSRSQVLKTRSLDLNRTVLEAEAILSRLIGERIAIRLELEPHLPPIEAEPSQVFQVLLNLSANARDAMPAGGKVTIRTARLEITGGEPEFRPSAAGGSFAALEVLDTGNGIDSATQQRIFEPFYTNKCGGTGLGLAVVYGIVTQAGGHVRVLSKVGEGTSITALFPFSHRPISSAEVVSAPHSAGPAGQRTVLLVEDQQLVRDSIRELLTFLGYGVIVADDADQAESACRSAGPELQILLTDVIMPGNRGPEVAARARAVRPGISVIYMSGFTESESDAEVHTDAEALFIAKPFTLQALRLKLSEALQVRS